MLPAGQVPGGTTTPAGRLVTGPQDTAFFTHVGKFDHRPVEVHCAILDAPVYPVAQPTVHFPLVAVFAGQFAPL